MIPSNINMEDQPCPMGCPSKDQFVLTGHDRINSLPGEFTIVKCHTCGLMRTNPRPTPESISFYYPSDYGPYMGTRIEAIGNDTGKASIWKQLAKKIFQFNTKCMPPLGPGRMLEIGCASGLFLHEMANRGWHVEGLEVSKSAAVAAQKAGYNVYVGTIESAPDPAQPYDIVVGWMVLEHLHDPLVSLQRLNSWVKPGGWLVVSVPNAGSLEFLIFKDAWYALHLPNHLCHFTPKTIKALLSKAGWQIQTIIHQRVLSNMVNSICYRLLDRNPQSYLAKYGQYFVNNSVIGNILLYPLAYPISLIGQTGRMTVWARRAS